MIQDAHDRLRPVLAKRDHGFRWRGHDISRIEGLSDAVFAFAITLLVVSLEVPKTFGELREMMRGFLSFGMCFALLLLIWHAQYLYFRRYALDDRRTFLLNAALLFVVAFYIYPLKFLFTAIVDQVTGFQAMKDGVPIPRMNLEEWSQLMLIYGAGYIGVYVIFALLYLHAYRLRDMLELTELERFDTRYQIFRLLTLVAVGLIAALLACIPLTRNWSSLVYIILFPILRTSRHVHRRRRAAYLAAKAV